MRSAFLVDVKLTLSREDLWEEQNLGQPNTAAKRTASECQFELPFNCAFPVTFKIQCKQYEIPYREVWKQKLRVSITKCEKGFFRWKVYFSFKFQVLAPRGLVFAPATKYARISRAFAFDKSKFLFLCTFLLVALVWLCGSFAENVGNPTKYFLSGFIQSCRTPSRFNSLPCPLGRNTEEQQQVLGP